MFILFRLPALEAHYFGMAAGPYSSSVLGFVVVHDVRDVRELSNMSVSLAHTLQPSARTFHFITNHE